MMEEFASSSWFKKKVSLRERRSIQLPVLWNLKQAVYGLTGESLYVFETDPFNCMSEATCITQVAVDDLGHKIIAFFSCLFPSLPQLQHVSVFYVNGQFFPLCMYISKPFDSPSRYIYGSHIFICK